MSRVVVAVVALAVVIASPGVATAVVDVLDSGHVVSDAVSDDAADQDNGPVDVATGSQLSTILSTTEDEVGAEVSQSAFDSRFATANETERARLLADRAAAVTREASAAAADYREATAAYQNGSINRSTYAQRLATLNARARTLQSDLSHVRDRATSVSDLELATAGYDESALDEAAADLDSVASPGTTAVFERFTGQSDDSVAVASANGTGVSIEVESDAGEHTRELRQSGDDDENLTVGPDEALATARESLSDRPWTLRKTSVDVDEGSYEFEFGFATANATGEAEVRVDGSAGIVVGLEEEIEAREGNENDEDDEDSEDDGDGPPLVLVVTDGEPTSGGAVTLEVRQGGSPVSNATVFVDDEVVGTTAADGQIEVILGVEETDIVAERGDREAELEFEFDDESDRPVDGLNVAASLDDDAVTVTVTYEGEGVPGAQVSAGGDRVGSTGPDGTASFADDSDEDLELEIVRGQIEIERTYHVENGTLVREEPDTEGDQREDERPEDGDGSERGEQPDEMTLSVVEGEPAPNATVTLEARVDGEPTPDVRVFVDGGRVGSTDSDGRVEVTLTGDEAEIEAERGDLEADLEFEFDGDGSEDADDSGGNDGEDGTSGDGPDDSRNRDGNDGPG